MQDFQIDAISASDIIDTVRSGLVVLDSELNVMSVNRAFCSIFETDHHSSVGKRLYDLGNGQWQIPALKILLEEIVPRTTTVEGYEVDHVFPDIGRKIMLLNARKVYRPGNNNEFLLLAIDDVTDARDLQIEAERNMKLAETIVGTIRDPLVILEEDLTVVTASREFLRLFGADESAVFGQNLKRLGQGQWDVQALTALLERVVPDEAPINGFLLEDDFPGLGRRVFKINARKVHRPGNHVTRLLVVFEDATDATLADRHRDVLAAELAHRIKNNLQVISAFVAFEIRRAAEPCLEGYRAMQSRINAVAELYDVIAHSSAFGPVSMPTYLEGIASSIRASLLGERSDISVKVDSEEIDLIADFAVPVGLIVNELSTNAVKHAFSSRKGEIVLGFRRRDDEVVLTVRDNGVGSSSSPGQAGLGSRFIDAFVKQIGGTLATGSGATGTTVTVRLPKSVIV